MKKIRLFLLAFVVMMLLPATVMASESDEAAIRKQIKTLETGIRKHDYSKVKKVVKKPYSSFCDFKRLDKLIGKSFLKKKNKDAHIDIVSINVHGDSADVTIGYGYYDCSHLYYATHNNLWIYGNHKKSAFSKELKNVEKKNKLDIYKIGNKNESVEMKRIKGKWVFTLDPNAIFVNMYSCGYIRLQQNCYEISSNCEW